MSGSPGVRAADGGAFGRGLAFLGYGLLLLALPSLGASALLALILAYALRDGSAPLVASHHRFQIRIFWIGLVLLIVAAALATAALMDAVRPAPTSLHIPVSPHAQLIDFSPDNGPPATRPADVQVYSYSFGRRAFVWRTRALLEGYGAAVLLAFTPLWGLGAPLYGAVRLASGRGMGHRPS